MMAVFLGRASMAYVVAFLAVAFALGIAFSFAAVALEELSLRQLSTCWRIRGMISKLGGAQAWGAMERRGFRPTPTRA